MKDHKPNPRIPKVFSNMSYKLVALLVAVGLFAFIHFERGSQATVRVELRWSSVPDDRMIIDDSSANVRAVLDGPGTLLKQVQNTTLAYEALSDELVLGTNQVRIDPARLALPRGVTIRTIAPAMLEVEYTEVERRVLPVKVNHRGKVAEGFRLVGVRTEPTMVALQVRKGQLDGSSVIPTIPLELEGRTTSFEAVLDLDLAGLTLKDVKPKIVKAFVEIETSLESKLVSNVPVQIRGVEPGTAELMPESVNVSVELPDASNDVGVVEAFVEIDRLPEKPVPLAVKVLAREGVVVHEITPAVVVVRSVKVK